MWSTYSLPLLSEPLRPEVEVPVRIPSIGQVDLFKIIRIRQEKLMPLIGLVGRVFANGPVDRVSIPGRVFKNGTWYILA